MHTWVSRAEAESRRDNSAKSLFDFINVNLSTGQASSSGIKRPPAEKEKSKKLIKDESFLVNILK